MCTPWTVRNRANRDTTFLKIRFVGRKGSTSSKCQDYNVAAGRPTRALCFPHDSLKPTERSVAFASAESCAEMVDGDDRIQYSEHTRERERKGREERVR